MNTYSTAFLLPLRFWWIPLQQRVASTRPVAPLSEVTWWNIKRCGLQVSCQDAKEQDTIIMSFNLALKPEIMDRALELGEGRTAKAIVN